MGGVENMFDLRDEEQAKEYLNTIGIEYRFQCYKEKNPEGCHRLADFFEAFKRDIPMARRVYQENCDDNKFGHSCFKIGNYNMLGKAGEVDMVSALRYFEMGCSHNYSPSCHNVALVHHLGKLDGHKDYVRAADYLKKGCDGNNTPSCQLLSTYFITGKDGIPKDMTKAFEYAFKACDLGHMYACANLSQMYRKGDGTEKNTELSEKYKKRAKTLFNDVATLQQTMTFGK